MADPLSVTLAGHLLPASLLQDATPYSPTSDQIQLAVRLRMHGESELNALLKKLYDPGDALYGRYLAPGEFRALRRDRFGDQKNPGLPDGPGLHGGGARTRSPLDAACRKAALEAAFGVKISHWLTPGGRAAADD